MKSVVFLIFLIIEKLQCRSANDFLKDVFSMEDDPKEQKCSTMQCQTAGKIRQNSIKYKYLITYYYYFFGGA